MSSVCSKTDIQGHRSSYSNDGSTDNSLQVCEEFCKQDVRFHVFNQKNHGVSYSRNQGIKKANGQYLMFVDGDDEVLPDMVQQYIVSAKMAGQMLSLAAYR